MNLEKMKDFFISRVDGYDTHMLTNVEGCKEGCTKMAEIMSEHYFKAGKAVRYNNCAFVLLGLVIKKLTGVGNQDCKFWRLHDMVQKLLLEEGL